MKAPCHGESCPHYVGYVSREGDSVLDACMLARFSARRGREECPADRDERIAAALAPLRGVECPGTGLCPARSLSGEWLSEYCDGCGALIPIDG